MKHLPQCLAHNKCSKLGYKCIGRHEEKNKIFRADPKYLRAKEEKPLYLPSLLGGLSGVGWPEPLSSLA